jgi:hypothetical protein
MMATASMSAAVIAAAVIAAAVIAAAVISTAITAMISTMVITVVVITTIIVTIIVIPTITPACADVYTRGWIAVIVIVRINCGRWIVAVVIVSSIRIVSVSWIHRCRCYNTTT